GRERGTLKLTYRLQSEVRKRAPAVFVPCEGAWGRRGWTYVELAHADYAQLEPLMHEAWRLTAPKSLAAAAAIDPDAQRPTPKRRKPR
ncbi:MAG TPA: hypothetical protein VK524_28315, partial [Polyangiaceae bacterium]|nr:hypothetical protein [Polyangiaceae bacterium]